LADLHSDFWALDKKRSLFGVKPQGADGGRDSFARSRLLLARE
jgi:hypothetical protein